MLKVYLYQVNKEDLARHAEEYLRALPAWRTQRYHRMKIESGKQEELAAGLLLRHALLDAADMDLMTVEVTTNEHGKPMFSVPKDQPGGQIHFNISHPGGYVSVAVADCPVGVDVETNSDPDLKVTDRFYSAEEQAAVRGAKDPQKVFRRLWTRKEAYVKCTGTGIYNAVSEIPSLPDVSGEFLLITLKEEPEYTLSVVVKKVESENRTLDSLQISLDIVTKFDV